MRRALTRSRVVLLAVVALLSVPLSGGAVATAYDEAHPVLAYYYAWWNRDVFGRALYQPGQAYDSDDTAAMQRHIEQAQSAGVDGFVVSWLGYQNRTDVNMVKLLDLARQRGFRVSAHFETTHFAPYGVEDVTAQLLKLHQERINHPAWVTYQGRPVIFFWRASTYDNGTWSAIRARVDPERRAIWLADGDNFNILSGDAWDGISPYAIAWSGNPAGQLPSWGAKAAAVAPEKLYVPPVSPGCDDTAARAPTCIQDRQGGAYYAATWDGALASNPPWAVIVSTFNEWLESTQIEPSAQYGDQYLQITRQYAEAFKGTTVAGVTAEGPARRPAGLPRSGNAEALPMAPLVAGLALLLAGLGLRATAPRRSFRLD